MMTTGRKHTTMIVECNCSNRPSNVLSWFCDEHGRQNVQPVSAWPTDLLFVPGSHDKAGKAVTG